MSLDRYNKIVKLPKDFNQIKIVPHIPSPNEIDYQRGYIVRYFVQKANDINSVIYEIRKKSTAKLSQNSFYNIISLDCE